MEKERNQYRARPALHILAGVLVITLGCLDASADWPQWRGPQRDGQAESSEKISPGHLTAPKKVWRNPVGGGFSSPIIVGKKLLFTDEDGSKEILHCVEAETGKELWKYAYAEMFGDEWGKGPRSTPFSDGENVFVQSCNGEFYCISIETGKPVWGFKFEDYGVKFLGSKAREGTASRRGNNGSGILDGREVIVLVGGRDEASLVCLDKNDGTLRWKSGSDEAAYSSLVVGNLAGARQVVAFNADALVGADRITGEILWRVPLKTNAKRHTMTPVLDGNRVYVTSHTLGAICFEISRENGGFVAKEKWRNPEEKINLATPVLVDGHLYSHGAKKNFVCINAETGQTRWSQPGFGNELSSTLAVGGQLLVLTDGGEAVLVKANPEEYEELARTQLGAKNWNHPAISDGKLFIRDSRELACFSLE